MDSELRYLLSRAHPEFTIKPCETEKGKGVFTKRRHKKNSVLHKSTSYLILGKSHIRTFEQKSNFHFVDNIFGHLNHSCRPNCVVVPEMMMLIALRDIEGGEELTCFYPATESNLCRPFDCLCGQPNCLGHLGQINDTFFRNNLRAVEARL